MAWWWPGAGWGRLRSLQLPQRDVASIDVPMTFKGQDWVATVEAAVVPGHGQVRRGACQSGGKEGQASNCACLFVVVLVVATGAHDG